MAAKRRSNGDGSVYWNEARKRWEGMVTVPVDGGPPKRKKVGGPTKTEVQKKVRQLREDVSAGNGLADRTSSMKDVVQWWRTERLPYEDIRDSTRRSYDDLARMHVARLWGHQKLAALTAADIELGLRKLAKEGKARDTVRLVRAVLGKILGAAERDGMLAKNPNRFVKMPKMAPAKQRKAMTVDQLKTLLAHVEGTRLWLPIKMAVTTGLRPGELLALCWADLDLAGGSLQVKHAKTRSGLRPVELRPEVVESLREHRGASPDAEFVFGSTVDTKWDLANYRKLFQRACREAGLGEWTPHELRHTCASWLIAENVPLKIISEMLGHSSISVTADVYGHLLGGSREVADTMQRLLAS